MLEEQLRDMQRPVGFNIDGLDSDQLKRVCAGVAEWLARADDSERTLALEALQIDVEATKEEATVTGALPVVPPEFVTIEQTLA